MWLQKLGWGQFVWVLASNCQQAYSWYMLRYGVRNNTSCRSCQVLINIQNTYKLNQWWFHYLDIKQYMSQKLLWIKDRSSCMQLSTVYIDSNIMHLTETIVASWQRPSNLYTNSRPDDTNWPIAKNFSDERVGYLWIWMNVWLYKDI